MDYDQLSKDFNTWARDCIIIILTILILSLTAHFHIAKYRLILPIFIVKILHFSPQTYARDSSHSHLHTNFHRDWDVDIYVNHRKKARLSLNTIERLKHLVSPNSENSSDISSNNQSQDATDERQAENIMLVNQLESTPKLAEAPKSRRTKRDKTTNVSTIEEVLSPTPILQSTSNNHKQYNEEIINTSSLTHIAICMAVAFAWSSILLLPLTMLALEMLNQCSSLTILMWLDLTLITRFWDTNFIGCNSALFFIIPFAYFYNEAEDIHSQLDPEMNPAVTRAHPSSDLLHLPNKTPFRWKRARKSFLLLCTLGFLIVSAIHVIAQILELSNNIHPMIILNAIICIVAALMLCVAAPTGIVVLIEYAMTFAIAPNFKHQLQNRIDQLEMEEQTLQMKMSDIDDIVTLHHTQMTLNDLFKVKHKLKESLKIAPLSRNIIFLTILILTMIGWILFILKILFSVLSDLYDGVELVLRGYSYPLIKLELVLDQTSSLFRSLGIFLELYLTLFFTIISLLGTFRLRLFQHLQELNRSAGTQSTITSVIILLFYGAAIPIAIRLLGLTSLEFVGIYKTYALLKSRIYIHNVYKLLMVGTCIVLPLEQQIRNSFNTWRQKRTKQSQ